MDAGLLHDSRTTARLLAVLAGVWALVISLWRFVLVADVSAWGQRLAASLGWIDWPVLLHPIAAAGLAALVAAGWPERVGAMSRARRVGWVVGISLAVEFAQTLIADRHGSLADAVAHVLGGMAGLWLAERGWLTPPLRLAARPAVGWLAVVIVVLFTLTLAVIERRLTSFRNWDAAAVLVLGNEATGDRPWLGRLHGVAIYTNALEEQQVRFLTRERWRTSQSESARLQRGAFVVYSPANAYQLTSLTGLRWMSSGRTDAGVDLFAPPEAPIRVDERGVNLLGSTVMATAGPAAALTEALAAEGAFSIEAYVSPAGLLQTGPAWIVSLSRTPGKRNLTLAQDGTALSFRVRTPLTGENGDRRDADPKWPNVFNDSQPKHLVVTYGHGELRLYVNGEPQGPPHRLQAIHRLPGGSPAATMATAAACALLPLGLVGPPLWNAARRPRRAVAAWLVAAGVAAIAFHVAVGPGGGWYALAVIAGGVLVALGAMGRLPVLRVRPQRLPSSEFRARPGDAEAVHPTRPDPR